MSSLFDETLTCPYCGEVNWVMIEFSGPHELTIEDCRVCCRPIRFSVAPDGALRAVCDDDL